MPRLRVGILTGGGDAPGLNAVIRVVAKRLIHEARATVVGIRDGFDGLVEGRARELRWDDVSGILGRGGTILGTSNKGNPFDFHGRGDRSRDAMRTYRRLKLGAIVAIGGDGTMAISGQLARLGARIVGVPKTIDNDVEATEVTFGFDSAVRVVAEALDGLHATADAHRRVIVVETMGRTAGWLALYGGVAGGADVILIPEIAHRIERVYEYIRDRHKRRRFTILAVAEGVCGTGKGPEVARRVQEETGFEARAVVLGHLQRAGGPTAFDRILATRFGFAAVDALLAHKRNVVVVVRRGRVEQVPLAKVSGRTRLVPPGHEMVRCARALGTSFGD